MAADFSQDAVLHFLQSHGGSAKNADLLLHFRAFLRDHADRDRNREQFKKFVNSVATVRQEDGVSHVVLRRRFRGFVPGEGAGARGLQSPRSAPTSADSGSRRPAWTTEKPRARALHRRQETEPGPVPGPEELVLPAAGIIPNNNNNNNNLKHHRAHIGPGLEPEVNRETNLNLKHHRAHIGPGPEPEPEVSRETNLKYDRAHIGPEPEVSRETNLNLKHDRAHIGPGPEPEVSRETNLNLKHDRAHIGPGPEPGPEVNRETNLNLKHDRAHIGPGPEPEPEVYTQTPYAGQPRPAPCRLRHRKSYKSAVSVDDDDDDEDEAEEEAARRPGSVRGARPLSRPLLQTARVSSSSSPCIMEAPPSSSSPSHRDLPQIFIQDVDQGRDWTQDASVRCSLPLEAELCGAAQRAGPLTRPSPRTPSSHGSIFSLSDTGSSSLWSSCEDLETGTGEAGGGATQRGGPSSVLKTQWSQLVGLHDDQETSSPLVAFHRSMGDLYVEEAESSDGSASSLAVRRRVSRLRSRMCRSLGSDLDQLLQEEDARQGGGAGGGGSAVARLKRLHLLSSSLSLRHNLSSSSLSSCSTPPRCHSFSDLAEGMARRKSLPDAAAALDRSTRPSQVPLESREHAWLVKAAAGAWPEIYSLFREDSSLLNRRDFISGFTVLHWIAKHGDHRVLNTLWYGVEKAGLTFDINAQSSCGHTPLHIATIHNHKNVIRLLVNKFSADLRRRDTAGKRAWQYLGRNAAPDLFSLLGAPLRAGLGLQGEGQRFEPQQPQRRHRRRRHHFSSAGEKPLNLTKVKRSSSIAAFLKHKSIQRLTARPRSEAFL